MEGNMEENKKKNEEENREGYSYHYFIFPFIWNSDEVKTRQEFSKKLRMEWEKEIINDEEISKETDLYTQYQYFNEVARSAIFSREIGKEDNNQVVWNYLYKPAKEGKLYYRIEKSKIIEVEGKAAREEKIIDERLKINKIRLKLFNSNIGVLIFDMEHLQEKSDDIVNRINEYGRRIFAPYLNGEIKCDSCADKISIVNVGNEEIISSSLMELKENPLEGSLPHKLLFADTERRNDIKIEPIIDDRMFVACYYQNTEMINSMKEYKNGEYEYINSAMSNAPDDNNSPANRLYRYVFVDGEDITCISRNMLVDMLKKHIYERWIEWNSLSGISDYSMVTLTNSGAPIHLLSAFQTEYVEMAILALVQRAAILNFKNEISQCTLGKEKISNVHKEYLIFKSQLYLNEVTPQQQGIELYDMLQEHMYIEEQIAEIDDQIDALYTQQTAFNEKVESTILYIIAALGITGTMHSIADWCIDEYYFNIFGIKGPFWILYVIIVVIILIYRKCKHRK